METATKKHFSEQPCTCNACFSLRKGFPTLQTVVVQGCRHNYL